MQQLFDFGPSTYFTWTEACSLKHSIKIKHVSKGLFFALEKLNLMNPGSWGSHGPLPRLDYAPVSVK